MLSRTDADVIRAWLSQALSSAEKTGGSKAALASFCGVTTQAVDGWLRTGRITKSNLEKAKTLLRSSPDLLGTALVAREEPPSYSVSWPFRFVSISEISALPKRRLDRLDKLLRERLDEWLEDDASGKRRAA